jgi:hypothetical protein
LAIRGREEVAGGWRRLHQEELHNLYASPDIVRVIKSRMILARQAARMGKINIYKILAEKPERKRPVGTSTCR